MKTSNLFGLVLLVSCVLAEAGHAATCDSRRYADFPRVPAEGIVYTTQVLGLHQAGEEIPDLDFSGPGFCYVARKDVGEAPVDAFKYERLGVGRGEAYEAYLTKKGPRHALVFGSVFYPRYEQSCLKEIERQAEVSKFWMEKAPVNQYDISRKVYQYEPSYPAYGVEEHEIRRVADGAAITFFSSKDLYSKHVLCIFPNR